MIILYIITCLFIFYGTIIKSRKSLHMFQQNLYNENNRYLKWIFNNLKDVFYHYDLIALLLCLIGSFTGNIITVILYCLSILIILMDSELIKISIKEEKRKKELVKTARVKRQIGTLYILNIIPIVLLIFTQSKIFVLISSLLLVLNYLLVWLVGIINKPIEKGVYYHFWNKASNKLKSINNLKVIGITGSYGKTSSKNVVYEILKDNYITLKTPKNYNTDVGLMSTVNNDMDKFTEIFIAEMGAYKVGRIKNSCNLVKPKYGILTTIGKAHLETFKSEQNIINTKFELIESLPKDGTAFLNMDDENQVNYNLKNKVKVIWYAVSNKNADVYAENVKCTNTGLSFDVCFKDGKERYSFSTKLLGSHNISNILCAIAVGKEFGVSIETMQNNVKMLKAVEHRLELKKIGNFYQIDDAYNSNPIGAKNALEVLSKMPGKKIIVTPGMVELGSEQDKYNYEFGKEISKVCDLVILVGEKQTEVIYKGLIDSKYNKDNIIVSNDVRKSYELINNMYTGKEDLYALYENDLPDNYNEIKKGS